MHSCVRCHKIHYVIETVQISQICVKFQKNVFNINFRTNIFFFQPPNPKTSLFPRVRIHARNNNFFFASRELRQWRRVLNPGIEKEKKTDNAATIVDAGMYLECRNRDPGHICRAELACMRLHEKSSIVVSRYQIL